MPEWRTVIAQNWRFGLAQQIGNGDKIPGMWRYGICKKAILLVTLVCVCGGGYRDKLRVIENQGL